VAEPGFAPRGQICDPNDAEIAMSHTEQPRYTVIASHGPLEVREYGPLVVAETQVCGPRQDAIQQGFRRIAGYIFGGNASQQKIAMTAPVIQQQREAVQLAGATEWAVRFVMPSAHSLATLPLPKDAKVKLSALEGRRYAAIRFSGTGKDQNIHKHLAILEQHIAAQNLKVIGPPLLAFYNPPWTLPFLRRNEIWLELAPPTPGAALV
jgi:hypothetical protein